MDIEKIKKWVQKQMELYWEKLPDADDEHPSKIQLRDLGQYMAYENMESFLDTLSEEPDKSLEEAAEEYGKTQYGRKASLLPDRCRGCYAPIVYAFKAGAEWQKEHMEQLADEVDFAKHLEHLRESQRQANLDKFIEFRWGEGNISKVNFIDSIKSAFEIGQEQMKQQMMKEAVEGKVFMSFAPGHNQMVMADVDLPTNTKVKLYVFKEEGE